MLEFVYDEDKEKWLMEHRGVSFKMVISKLESREVEDIIPNPNQRKYKGQEVFIIEMDNYMCVVPYIEKGNKVFLKTIYKNRKINERYKHG